MLGPIKEWGIQDCINVHKLLETVFSDQDVANSKFQYAIRNLFIAPYVDVFFLLPFVMFCHCIICNWVQYPAITNVMYCFEL